MKRRKRQTPAGLVPAGSTLINLACTDTPHGAFQLGTMVNIVGDSSAGKSMLGLTLLAEIAQNPAYKDHLLVYDDVEQRLFFDISKLFGNKLKERITGPNGPVTDSCSATIESFYYHIADLLEQDTPFVYVLDSMDGLTSDAETKKFQERKEAFEKDKPTAGSYGDGKAKVNSENLRKICLKLRGKKSLLFIISQTRDNIGLGFQPKTRAGGRALTFYAAHVLWLAVTGKIKKTVKGKQRTIGSGVRCKVTKNSITGRQIEVDFDIYYAYGIDDVTSCIDFLIEEKEWKKNAGVIKTPFGFEGKEDEIAKYIEENGLEQEVKLLCKKVWDEITEQLIPKRKKKYE